MMTYVVTGLTVSSEIALRDLTPIEIGDGSDCDVTIRVCEQIGSPDAKIFANEWIEAGEHDFLFRAKPGLAFRIRNGHEILVCKAPEISDPDVHLFLMGSAWGVLCHQRGLLPIHCSAAQFGGQVFAFTGPSGAGKSTLAAGLATRGIGHFCDDVCVIDLSDESAPLWPMPKGLKLWRDAADALGLERGEAVSTDSRLDKFYVSCLQRDDQQPVSIAALYVLARTEFGPHSITRLRGSAHFSELFASVYRTEWLGWIRDPASVFRQVAELSGKLDLYWFSRPDDLGRFDEGLDFLEAHMTEIAARELEDGDDNSCR